MEIPRCGKKCDLDKFENLYRDIIPRDDFETECGLDDRKQDFAETDESDETDDSDENDENDDY